MLVGWVAVVAGPVAADEGPRPAAWELQWVAPDDCPDADAVRERVAALVQVDPAGVGTLYVDARIDHDDTGWGLTLSTVFGERRDTREVHADSCADLGDATALVVAVSLDPRFSGDAAGPEVPAPTEPAPSIPTPDPAPTPVPDEPPTPRADEPLPTPRPPTDRRTRPAARDLTPRAWAIRIAPQLELGALPPFGGGFELAVGLQWTQWHFDVHGTYLWPRSVDGPLDTAARLQQGSAGARACWVPTAGTVGFPICGGVDAGLQRADSRGLSPATTASGPWAGPSAGAGVTAGGRRVAFWSLLEATGALSRTQVLIGEARVFRPWPVAVRLIAGVQIVFAIKSG